MVGFREALGALWKAIDLAILPAVAPNFTLLANPFVSLGRWGIIWIFYKEDSFVSYQQIHAIAGDSFSKAPCFSCSIWMDDVRLLPWPSFELAIPLA
jgi:hypothetical protein